MNKKFLIGIVTAFFLCTVLTTSASSMFEKYNPNKTSNSITTLNSIKVYMDSINDFNSELAKEKSKDVVSTITFSKGMSMIEMEEYISKYDIDAVQLQARGYDKNGKRITFFSRTDIGIKNALQTLETMANSSNVKFAGVIGMYAFVNSEYIDDIQSDAKTLLLDTSADEYFNDVKNASTTAQKKEEIIVGSKKQDFVHSIAWDAEDTDIVSYDVIK